MSPGGLWFLADSFPLRIRWDAFFGVPVHKEAGEAASGAGDDIELGEELQEEYQEENSGRPRRRRYQEEDEEDEEEDEEYEDDDEEYEDDDRYRRRR